MILDYGTTIQSGIICDICSGNVPLSNDYEEYYNNIDCSRCDYSLSIERYQISHVTLFSTDDINIVFDLSDGDFWINTGNGQYQSDSCIALKHISFNKNLPIEWKEFYCQAKDVLNEFEKFLLIE